MTVKMGFTSSLDLQRLFFASCETTNYISLLFKWVNLSLHVGKFVAACWNRRRDVNKLKMIIFSSLYNHKFVVFVHKVLHEYI